MPGDERFKEEWQDFEKRFQRAIEDHREHLDKMPAELRQVTENKMRERYWQYEKDDVALESEKGYDFYDPKTQGRWTSLVEFVHRDMGMAVEEARKAIAGEKDKDSSVREAFRSLAEEHEPDRER